MGWPDIQGALTTSITVIVNSICWFVTLVACGMESVFIRFHNVEFGAPVTSDLIGIAIFERVIVIVDTWHEDSVKR
jgi:hypothetical protein